MNRRDDIIETAVQLFTKQGYRATSIRQIASGVGCRESAIYVHFQNGKRELLQTILKHHMPDFDAIIGGYDPGTAPENAPDQWRQHLVSLAETHFQDWQWIAGEFPMLEAGERAIVREKLSGLHQALVNHLQPTIGTEAETRSVAWAFVAMLSGYAQLLRIFQPDCSVEFSHHHVVNGLKALLADTASLNKQASVQ